MNRLIKQDLQQLIYDEQDLLAELNHKTVFITGATGLVGSQIVYLLLLLNETTNANIKILALVRDISKAQSLFEEFMYSSQLEFIQGDILNLPAFAQNIDFIIHGACITSSADFVNKPVDTISVILQGTQNILSLALEKNVKSMVYLSSLEVYGVVNQLDTYESDIGYIDFTHVRSSYSEGKRMAECMCIAYEKQYNLPIKIARLAQTFGPGIDIKDNRVFAQFARSVILQKDIILHTTGETERNYCYTKDAVSAFFYILLKGENAQAYNVANENTQISIRQMAELVANLDQNRKIDVVLDLKDAQLLGYNPLVKIKLKTQKLENLGWSATVDLADMFKNLICYLQEKV